MMPLLWHRLSDSYPISPARYRASITPPSPTPEPPFAPPPAPTPPPAPPQSPPAYLGRGLEALAAQALAKPAGVLLLEEGESAAEAQARYLAENVATPL
jgi:hypothetical protein